MPKEEKRNSKENTKNKNSPTKPNQEKRKSKENAANKNSPNKSKEGKRNSKESAAIKKSPIKPKQEKRKSKENTDNKNSPTKTKQEKRSSKDSADNKNSPTKTRQEKRSSKDSTDNKKSPTKTKQEKRNSKDNADNKNSPIKTKQEKRNSKNKADKNSPNKSKKQKKKSEEDDMDDKFCYAVNIICQKLYMPGRDFECRDELCIEMPICKGCKPVLDATRIDVNCMPLEPLCEFAMEPECLQECLSEGILMSVQYMGKEIACGSFKLPAHVIERMCNISGDTTHISKCELGCKCCTVGLATVKTQISMRCPTQEEKESNTRQKSGGNRKLTSYCLPSSDSSDPCLGFYPSDHESQDNNIRSNCSHRNKRSAKDESLPDNNDFCATPPTKLVDMAGPFTTCCWEEEPDRCAEVEAAPGPSAQFAMRSALGDGNINRLCAKFSSPHLKQTTVMGRRCCPLCQEDLSWLPKIATCPQCGYKPVPEFKEQTYNEKLTAEALIIKAIDSQQSFGSVSGSSVQQEDEPKETNNSDEFEDIVKDYKLLKKSIKKNTNVGTCPMSAAAQSSVSKQSPHMAKVFEELKNMFKLKDTDSKTKIADICEEACKMAKSSKARYAKLMKKVGEDPCAEPKKKRPKRRKPAFKSKFYSLLSVRKSHRLRHTECFTDAKSVPPHMGWLWTHNPLAKYPNWRPGAIRRSIRVLMGYFLKDFPVDTIPLSKYMSYYKNKKIPPPQYQEKAEDLVQVPTLHIEKKHDEYTITLRPLKDAESLQRAANPYADMKPVQFRIVKNPLLKQYREMKRCLKDMGFSKCKCHRPVMSCYCRSFLDKKRLLYELEQLCEQRQVDPSCQEELVLSETSDSEAEFDFGVTPPAGIMKPERLKSSHVVDKETQYDENDWATSSMFPHPPNAFVQYCGCTEGERKNFFKWIYGKGNVHAEPKPPIMRNIKKRKRKSAKGARAKGGYVSEELANECISQPAETAQFSSRAATDRNAQEDKYKRLEEAAIPKSAVPRRRVKKFITQFEQEYNDQDLYL